MKSYALYLIVALRKCIYWFELIRWTMWPMGLLFVIFFRWWNHSTDYPRVRGSCRTSETSRAKPLPKVIQHHSIIGTLDQIQHAIQMISVKVGSTYVSWFVIFHFQLHCTLAMVSLLDYQISKLKSLVLWLSFPPSPEPKQMIMK